MAWALLCALLVTGSILALQAHLRGDGFDPRSFKIFLRLFLAEDYPATCLCILALFLGLFPAGQRTAVAFADYLGNRPILAACSSGLVLAAGALLVYQRHPLSMDEYAPYLQSQIFAAGSLYGRFPPAMLDWLIRPGFQGYFIHASRESGQIASAYWPGFALLLTPFTALHAAWLCNPVLGGIAVWVVHRLALELTRSTAAAGAAILFTIGSAAFTVNAISFYSMTAHLLCNATFALLLLQPSVRRCAAAGCIGGLALTLHNPVPHLFFAAPWLLWLLLRGERRHLAALAAGYLPWVAGVGFGWHQLLDGLHPGGLVAGTAALGNPLFDALRIFTRIFALPGEQQLAARGIELAKLWLWAAPGSVALAVLGCWLHRADRRFQLLLASALCTLVGYLFIPLDQGHGWGFRYFHSAWFVVPLLAAATLVTPAGGRSLPPAAASVARYGLALAMAGLLVMTPLFAYQVRIFISDHLAQVPTTATGQARVVIIDPATGYYAKDLAHNDPFLRDPVIMMISRGRARDAAMMAQSFPELGLLAQDYRGTVWGYAGTGRERGAPVGPPASSRN